MKELEKTYFSISAAARVTGLSKKYLYAGVHAGTVPYVRVGRVFRVNVPALLARLERDQNTEA